MLVKHKKGNKFAFNLSNKTTFNKLITCRSKTILLPIETFVLKEASEIQLQQKQ
jgi:hypothetical protein